MVKKDDDEKPINTLPKMLGLIFAWAALFSIIYLIYHVLRVHS